MGTAIKHPVPDRVKPSFAIFDIRALLTLSHMATVGVKGSTAVVWWLSLAHVHLSIMTCRSVMCIWAAMQSKARD